MKQPADLMMGIGSTLTVVASVLNLAALSDQPGGDQRLTWRARFVAVNRRHPRMRSTAMVCLVAALIADIGFAISALS